MRITYLSRYGPQGPSSRYRIFQYLPYFQKANVTVRIEPLFGDDYLQILRSSSGTARLLKRGSYAVSRYLERRQVLTRIGPDGVVIEHQLFPYLPVPLERICLPERFLLEFDDAIYRKHPRKMPFLIKRASGVIAGNNCLAEYAARYQANVHVVPTVIDTDRYRPPAGRKEGKIRIGWSGLEYNFKYLVALAPVFRKLLQDFEVEIVVLSGTPPVDTGFPFRFERWDAAREAEQIAAFDIGVMPLDTDEWCRGKCGMKLLQFMALRVPAVATPVGVNSEIVQHGVNGLLAGSLQEWVDCLSQLIRDGDLRGRLGSQGAATVRDRYSLSVWFPRLLEIYGKYFD